MAPPETRSQDRLGELEHRLESLHSTFHNHFEQSSQDISDLKTTATRLEELMRTIELRLVQPVQSPSAASKKPLGPLGHSDDGSSSTIPPRFPAFGSFQPHAQVHPYSIPTKQSRVEFPKFDGADFRGWAYRCRQFFEVDGTPPEHRIRLLSIHLEGHAIRWHQTFMRHRTFAEVRWEDYFQHMEAKFVDVRDEHPLIALKKLQQGEGPVADYERQFDELLSEVDIPEPIAINLFIGGLRPDIRQFVLNFSPPSLASATCSARLQEATIRTLHENTPNCDRRSSPVTSGGHSIDVGSTSSTVTGSTFGPFSSYTTDPVKALPKFSKPPTTAYPSSFASKPVTSSDSVAKPMRHLSKREMDERRRQGLCYWCPERYSSSNRCKDSHVYMLVIDDANEDFHDALGDTQGITNGNINVTEGSFTPSTLKLLARIKNQQIILLVDPGSTHNIIDASVVKRLKLTLQDRPLLRLSVADNRQVCLSQCCLNLNWEMGGLIFCSDFWVMNLGGYDAILGVDWLQTLGRFSMDMDLQVFEFKLNGQTVLVRGLNSRTPFYSDEVSAPMTNSSAPLTQSLPPIDDQGPFALEPAAILGHKITHRNNLPITQVLVQWKLTTPEDATWEDLSIIQSQYPHFSPAADASRTILVDKDSS